MTANVKLLNRFFDGLKKSMIEQHKKDRVWFEEIYGEEIAEAECLYTKDGLYNPNCKTKIIVR